MHKLVFAAAVAMLSFGAQSSQAQPTDPIRIIPGDPVRIHPTDPIRMAPTDPIRVINARRR